MAPMRDSDDKIIGATALSFTWFGQVNFSDISEDEIHAAEDGQPADPTTLDFEIKLRDYLLAFAEDKVRPKGYELDFSVASAYGDVAGEQILDDAIFMPVGFSLVCIYVVLMLGHLT